MLSGRGRTANGLFLLWLEELKNGGGQVEEARKELSEKGMELMKWQ